MGRPPDRTATVILGVDPGLASTGWALVRGGEGRMRCVESGTLRTSPGTPYPERLRALHDGIAEVAARGEVGAAAIEAWFVHPVSRAAMSMAEARGAILVALARAGLEVEEYAPNTIKQAVTGQGGAGKAQVRAMVSRLTGAEPATDHAADAMAAAICHLTSAPLRRAIRRAK